MADPVTNFAYTTVAIAPSPADSGVSMTPVSIATFPDPGISLAPGTAFNVVVWPSGAQATASNAEIVRVIAQLAGEWGIVREQEGTTARSIVVGDQIMLGPTAKTITDLDIYTTILVSLDASEIRALFATPLEIIPTPGASKVIKVTEIGYNYNFGTIPYFSHIRLRLGTTSTNPTIASIQDMEEDKSGLLAGPGFNDSPSAMLNQPVYLLGGTEMEHGNIDTFEIASGGTGYAVNDTGYIQNDSGSQQGYTVNSVSGGVVTALTLESVVVAGYQTGVHPSSVGGSQPGSGNSDLTIDITALDLSDGTVEIVLSYRILEFS